MRPDEDGAATYLTDLPAVELARMVGAGTASAHEVVAAHLERISQVNADLNAIVTLRDPEKMLADADHVDQSVREGADVPLAGVPFTVKDVIAAAGLPLTAGSPFLKDFVPTQDATVVARMRAAGAILIGKTNCPEFAMFGYTRNSLFGETKNPVGPVTVGGSSGGEAAAIASHCSALGLGGDFGGSLRWPAACTAAVALRPTAGRVPLTGQLPAPTLAEPLRTTPDSMQGRLQVIGPIARTVEDVGVALHVIAGPDGIDPLTESVALPWSREAHVRTVAVWEGPADPGVREDVRATVRAAAEAIAHMGIEIHDDPPPALDRGVTLYSELRDTDRLRDVRALVAGHEEELGEDARAAIAAAEGVDRTIPNPDRQALWDERDRLLAELLIYLDRSHVLLMPVATVPPFPLDQPVIVNGHEQSTWDVLAPSRLISLFGVPAASVPFGQSADGLPINVQVVGRPFREDEVLAIAHMLTEVTT
jgi:Asp-tRNA(Asn)/Glu-tRNA(Gln) amidotransferase A subunit family amidase